jgi:methionyl-tRNA formyltransferase
MQSAKSKTRILASAFFILRFSFCILHSLFIRHRTGLCLMRLIMLGTGPFAVPTLRALGESRHEILLVVTRPPQGRNPKASPLQRAGEDLNLTVWSPTTVNALESQARLKSLNPDLLVVCDYGEILRPKALAAAGLGGINLHGSLLPKYRGAAPVQWAILCGETETGNTVIHMTPGLDAGPILAQQRTTIDPDEDAAQLEERLATMGATAVLEVVDALEWGVAKPIPQGASQASKAPRLKKEQGKIDWARSSQEIKNQVRALRPWPRAYTFWRQPGGALMRLNIDRVALIDLSTEENVGAASGPQPGTVLETTTRLVVATADGALEIRELQPAGKRSMSAADFARGNRIAAGDDLGFEHPHH